MNSCSVLAGTEGCTTSTVGTVTSAVIGSEVAQRVVAEVGIEHDVDRHRAGIAEHQHVTVGRRGGHHLGGDHAAGAGTFSTTKDLPNAPVSFCDSSRASTSGLPPGAAAATRRTGRFGKSASPCANALGDAKQRWQRRSERQRHQHELLAT